MKRRIVKLLKTVVWVLVLVVLYKDIGRTIVSDWGEGGYWAREFRFLTCANYQYAPVVNGEYPQSFWGLRSRDNSPPEYITPEHFRARKYLYYVGGLRTNDPPRMPIMMRYDPRFPFWLEVKDLRSDRGPYSTSNLRTVRMLLTEPWKLVRDEFADEEEYKAFTNRLNVSNVTKGLKIRKHLPEKDSQTIHLSRPMTQDEQFRFHNNLSLPTNSNLTVPER